MSVQLQSRASFEATFLGFLYRQFTRQKPLPPDTDLTDNVAVVTGSNTGLGLEAARQLLELGLSHLILAVRLAAKGEAAAVRLRRDFPAAVVVVWIVDLESYSSVRDFAERCAGLTRLDIVILNAGLMRPSYTIAPETENELTLQVNYLSTLLLAILLLPVLKTSRVNGSRRRSVLSIVGSDLAYRARIESRGPVLKQFERPERYNGYEWYSMSKLLLALFVAKLADFVDPDVVLINTVNPGMTKGTDFFREFPSVMVKLMGLLQWLLARSVGVGAATYVDAVVSYGGESHGSFISDWAIKP
ncbi:NAD(P)-binding protein [Ophiocordyceps camponoti-floridani]|uniref:NAD(P)-binding protein n=1 Tax=Ophiocordyceps camponoti-floridani TaxID=2030778 RepID=A0A8H4QAC1_9HYPO|nr:NAD(P)-binding protein [Ophiocordyceps camponoti-floridani]